MKKLFSLNHLILLFIPIAILLFFIPNFLQGKVPIPADDLLTLYHPWRDLSIDGYNPGKFPAKNPLITDPVLQIYPWKFTSTKILKSGEVPLWNPFSFSGQPFMANIQSSNFQIGTLLNFLFPFNLSWTIQIVAPLIFSAAFMFLLLKRLNLSPQISFFGALMWPFSGFFVAWWEWGIITYTAMWLPLILLSIKNLFEKTSPIWFFILTFSLTQVIFAGHWQTGFYIFLISIFFAIYSFLNTKNLKSAVVLLTSLSIAATIASVQIIPSIEFVLHSARNLDQAYFPGRKDWFIPPLHLIQLLAPDFFGNPAKSNYWGTWNYAEFVSYIGIIPFSLALFALFKRNKGTTFFRIVLLAAFLFALENPISKAIYLAKIPLMSSMQPSRIIFLIDFCLIILSAFGLQEFFKEKSKIKLFLTPAVIFLLIIAILLFSYLKPDIFPLVQGINPQSVAFHSLFFAIIFSLMAISLSTIRAFKLPQKTLLALLIIFSLFDLFRFAQRFTSFSKVNWIFPQTQTTDYLQKQNRPFRVLSTDRRLFHPNTAAEYQIEDVAGYDPLYLDDYAAFVSRWNGNQINDVSSFNRIITPQNTDSKIISYLNVQYILTLEYLNNKNYDLVLEEGQTKVYENKNVFPRAYFVSQVTKTAGREQELEKVFDESSDLSKEAYSNDFEYDVQDLSAKTTFQEYKSQSFTLMTELSKEAPLVVSNVYYPGWRAYIDGKEAQIKRVNFMFQAVIVPTGVHEVAFKYQPKSFQYGLYLSLFGLLALCSVSIYLWKKQSQ